MRARVRTTRALSLSLSSAAVLLVACSSADQAVSQRRTGKAAGCPRGPLAWRRPLPPPQFLPLWLAGLRVREDRCVYLVFPRREEVRALWRTPAGEHVRGLSWAPDGKAFVLTTESHVVLLGRDGSLLRRFRATGAAFLHDGRLTLSRSAGIYLLAGSRWRRLASRQELERVAGFRARRAFSVSTDPEGFARGDGRGAVAVTLWSAGRTWKSVVLVVSAAGRVMRASPAYRAGGGEGAVYGWAWSPDGRKLVVTAEEAGPPARSRRGDHDHCVDVWSAAGGLRRAFCESQLPPAYQSHFAKVVWATDGKTALLDNGTVVRRDGRVAGRVPLAADDVSFQIQWEHPRR
jgi:dipeptidyl aminopeptidase/acylaminoacyl peptidase